MIQSRGEIISITTGYNDLFNNYDYEDILDYWEYWEMLHR